MRRTKREPVGNKVAKHRSKHLICRAVEARRKSQNTPGHEASAPYRHFIPLDWFGSLVYRPLSVSAVSGKSERHY